DKTTRQAASRTWSRRAWSVYPGLTESTALLIRFCLESGSLGMDAKLFLSFRPAEEAKHLEVCHMLAERLGGYEADPGEAGLARRGRGGLTPAEERGVLGDTITQVREGLAAWKLDLPRVEHAEIGTV